jgi:hypothetical protein
MTKTIIRRGALALSSAVILSSLPLASAEAQYYPRRNHAGEALAGGILGGVVGGLAAGAIINSARPAPVYVAPPPPVYVQPEPVYVEPAPRCWVERRKAWVDDYAWTWRHVRVCG